MFANAEASHQHSLETLNMLQEYDEFMESIGTLIDLGCGSGLDTEWWATRVTREDNPRPLNIQCTGVDQIDQELKELKQRSKELKHQKNETLGYLKHFMKFNEIKICNISRDNNIEIKQVSYNEIEKKQPLSIKKIKQKLPIFFDTVNFSDFITLSSDEKTNAIFNYLESTREKTNNESIRIKK